jgi:uncharacterized protein
MVKIFAAGDFHGDAKTASDLAEKAKEEGADLIFLNGDITEEDSESSILSHFHSLGKKIFLVPGNHDYLITDFLTKFYKVNNIHKNAILYRDIGVVGCSSLNVGLHQMTDEEIFSVIVENFKKIKNAKKKILITHVHPSGTDMEKFSDFVPGSKGLRMAIEKCQPDIVICGHVHEAEGLEEQIGKSKIINVGKQGKIFKL